jgi:hypothetical protein
LKIKCVGKARTGRQKYSGVKKCRARQLGESKREQKWHEVFYALQREGYSPTRAAKIATSRYGGHSDRARTELQHKEAYTHLFRSSRPQSRTSRSGKK